MKLDVGKKLYNKVTYDKNLVLRNTGKIHFDFELDLSPVVRKQAISISPLIGHLRGRTRQRFNCRVIPSELNYFLKIIYLIIRMF